MSEREQQKELSALLRLAYSAELAAAYAYRGHWHSVSAKTERERIRQIENEEWHHRELIGDSMSFKLVQVARASCEH
jgi:demethoxyubiquinone hydroxylase (CLK1/Coq7/Cat5 family)